MTAPKLRLWAKLIQSGRHESYDDPPPIPLITGPAHPDKAKKESLTDVFSGAACAIVKALQKPTTPTSHSRALDDCPKVSPLKVASLRRSCLEDLKKLKDLLEDRVLTEAEFIEEKKQILNTLKKFTNNKLF